MDINLGNIDNRSAIYRVGIGEVVTVVWLEFDEDGNFFIKNESDMEDRIDSLDNELKPKIRAFIASTNDLIHTAYLMENNK
ncbi:hypothetical protein CKN99_11875 [Carnobacterium maltaromaticum]|jgi:hypothetical protein|uniref:hypothetical protein n=1 Tax=Carnobacterium TaxID=2747 RepID=UPI000E747184|nr:hypothetical protein [Carnobacterium maltaromaticum]AOA04189.1 hypothetical protein BFC23_16100 [Carnobacterium maltaromaticum]MDT1946603.1 hypothetical protein [Carnobacterium maltaromaticum]MDT2000988.1 hypothetical protein [Carnobacterium maltaromaticum]MDW5525177.1 hypothetical protein [Carnobacterium maltaromaticum]TFJ25671.1 hypothetical protein CKN90_11830 [Carnobacterium maltaromaticum]